STGWFPISGMTSISNNHMSKIDSVYEGTYKHAPSASLSEQHKANDQKILELTQKDTIVRNLKKNLRVDHDISDEQITVSAGMIASELPKLTEFPKELTDQVAADYQANGAMSMELGRQVMKELRKLNYYTFSDKFSYTVQHAGRIF